MKHVLAIMMILMIFSSCAKPKTYLTGFEGEAIPKFSIQLPDSSTVIDAYNIPTDSSTVFIYFTPTCPYCNAQTKYIIKHLKELKHIKFFLLTNYPFAMMKDFYERYSLVKYPNVRVGVDKGNVFARYYKVQAIPFMAFINKNRQLTHVFIGKISASQILTASKK